MNPADQNRALIREFVEASNRHDLEAVEKLLAPAFERHCQATPGVQVRNRQQFLEFLENDFRTFPDAQVTLHRLLSEGDLVAIWASYEGTQRGPMGPFPPSGKRVQLDFCGIFRVEAGRIAELWVTWDNLAALQQLGHWPLPSS